METAATNGIGSLLRVKGAMWFSVWLYCSEMEENLGLKNFIFPWNGPYEYQIINKVELKYKINSFWYISKKKVVKKISL